MPLPINLRAMLVASAAIMPCMTVAVNAPATAGVASGGASAVPVLVLDGVALSLSVTNAATFATLELFADGVSQGTVTSPIDVSAHVGTFVAVKGTEAGKSGTISERYIVPQVLGEFDEPFTAANGTDFDGLNGWAGRPYTPSDTWSNGFEDGVLKVRSNDLSQYSSCNAILWSKAVSGGDHELIVADLFFSDGDNDANKRYLWGRTNGYGTSTTGVRLSCQATGYTIQTAGGGSLDTFVGVDLTAVSEVKLWLKGDRARVFLDGEEDATSAVANSGTGFDISGVPASSKVGYAGSDSAGNKTYGDSYRIASRIRSNSIPSNAVTLTSLTINDPALSDPTGSIDAVLGLDAAWTHFDYAVSGPDGARIVDWTTNKAVDSAGVGSFNLPLTYAMQGISGLMLDIRPTGTPGSMTQWPIGSIPYLQEAFSTLWGIQHDNVAIWSDEVFCQRDMGKMVTWGAVNASDVPVAIPDNDTYWRADGRPTGVMPPTGVAFTATFIDQGHCGFEQDGNYTASWPMANYTAAWRINENCTAGTINNGAKTAALTGMVEYAMVRAQIKLIPDDPLTPPANGLEVHLIRDNETETAGPFTDKFKAEVRPGTAFRLMKWQQIEALYKTTALNSTGLRDVPWATPEEIGLGMAQLQTKPHICIPVNATDAWATDFFTRLKTTLPAGYDFCIEFANELKFNADYVDMFNYAMQQACALGYVAGVSAGTYLAYAADAYVDISSGTGVTAVTLNPGDKFVTRVNYQFRTFEVIAASPIAPGYTLPLGAVGTDDGNVRTLATDTEMNPGKDTWALDRLIATGAIAKSVMAGHCAVELISGSFLLIDLDYEAGIILQNQAGPGTEYARDIDYLAPSGYATLNYSWGGAPSWLTGYAVQATFDTGFDAAARSAFADTVTALRNYKQGMFSRQRAADIPADQCTRTWLYEVNLHFTIASVPGGDQAGLDAAAKGYFESALAEALFDDFLAAIDSLGLKASVLFSFHVSFKPAGTLRYFGIETAVNSGADPVQGLKERRWISWNNFLDGKGL